MTSNHPTVGTTVTFTNPPAVFADLTGHTFTVEAVSTTLGGMLDPRTRAALAAGHAHLVMSNGTRRIGTTSDRVTA